MSRLHRAAADVRGGFNTPAVSTSGYFGGTAMEMLTGRTADMFDDWTSK